MPNSSACRCGRYDGTGDHLCHGNAYTCPRPGSVRYYQPSIRWSLAGVQMKLNVVDTVCCDECWAIFAVQLKAHHEAERQEMLRILARSKEPK